MMKRANLKKIIEKPKQTIKRGWLRALMALAVIAMLVAGGVIGYVYYIEKREAIFTTVLMMDQYTDDLDESWTASTSNPFVSEVKIESDKGFEKPVLVLYFYREGSSVLTLTKPGDQIQKFKIQLNDQHNLLVDKIDE